MPTKILNYENELFIKKTVAPRNEISGPLLIELHPYVVLYRDWPREGLAQVCLHVLALPQIRRPYQLGSDA